MVVAEIKNRIMGIESWFSEFLNPDFAKFPDELLAESLSLNYQNVNTSYFRSKINRNGSSSLLYATQVLDTNARLVQTRLTKNLDKFPAELRTDKCIAFASALFNMFCVHRVLPVVNLDTIPKAVMIYAMTRATAEQIATFGKGIKETVKQVTDWLIDEGYLKVDKRYNSVSVAPTSKTDTLLQ